MVWAFYAQMRTTVAWIFVKMQKLDILMLTVNKHYYFPVLKYSVRYHNDVIRILKKSPMYPQRKKTFQIAQIMQWENTIVKFGV